MTTSLQSLASKYGATVTSSPVDSSSSSLQKIASKYGATIASPSPQGTSSFAHDWLGVSNPNTYVQDSVTQAKQALANPIQTIGKAFSAGVDSIKSSITNVVEANKTVFAPHSSFPQQTADVLHSLVADVGVFPPFLALNAAFSAAGQVPGLKQAADVLNAPFAVTGKIGSLATGTFVDVLPVDQQTKDILKPSFEEVGSLAGQILLGGKIVSLLGKGIRVDKAEVDKAIEQTKVEEAIAKQQVTDHQATKTPAELHADYAKSQGYEPYTPPDRLPVIEAGKTQKSDLLTIQTEPPVSTKLGDLTLEPIKQAQPELISAFDTFQKATQAGDSATAQATLKDIQTKVGELTTKVDAQIGEAQSGVAKRVESLAIEKGLTKNGYDTLATYEKTNNKDAAQAIADLRVSGMDNYRAVLRNEKPLPEGVKAGALVADAYNYLKENPKSPHAADLAYELANSVHTGVFSEAGSTLQSGRGIADTAVGKFEQVKKAKEARAGEKAVKRAKSVPKEAKKAMEEVSLSKEDLGRLESFIDKITC